MEVQQLGIVNIDIADSDGKDDSEDEDGHVNDN